MTIRALQVGLITIRLNYRYGLIDRGIYYARADDQLRQLRRARGNQG